MTLCVFELNKVATFICGKKSVREEGDRMREIVAVGCNVLQICATTGQIYWANL